jgi:CheY-like chemotaxis protein
MAEETLAHAFEPFFTTKGVGQGTGLGLATCHGIVTQAGGRIFLDSVIGVGTKASILLPRVPVSAGAAGERAVDQRPRGDETVLLVEDETGVRKATARILRAQGYEVLEARDGVDALQQLTVAKKSVDLLLTDVVLPGMSGRELSERVHDAHPEIPTLFASGYTDDVVLQNQMVSQDAELLQKPFTSDALARRVRAVLDARGKGLGA